MWGDGTAGKQSSSTATGTAPPRPITVFGRIPTGQAVPTGAYSDTIMVTVTF